MSWYIGTLEECQLYDQKVTAEQNYTGSTLNWANPRQHPDGSKWAVKVNASVEKDEASNLIFTESLSEDWNPPEDE